MKYPRVVVGFRSTDKDKVRIVQTKSGAWSPLKIEIAAMDALGDTRWVEVLSSSMCYPDLMREGLIYLANPET